MPITWYFFIIVKAMEIIKKIISGEYSLRLKQMHNISI